MIDAKVREILGRDFGLDGNLAADEKLFSSGKLDSLSSLNLLMSLEGEFGVKISPLDISIDDIDSIEQIAVTVDRLTA